MGTLGPMSTSLEGIDLFMKTVLDAEPWDFEPGVVRLPWLCGKDIYNYDAMGKLKIAVMWHDGVVKPHPPVMRALNETVSKLRDSKWIEVVDWEPYEHKEACKCPLAHEPILGQDLKRCITARGYNLRTLLSRWRRNRPEDYQSIRRANAPFIKMDHYGKPKRKGTYVGRAIPAHSKTR